MNRKHPSVFGLLNIYHSDVCENIKVSKKGKGYVWHRKIHLGVEAGNFKQIC
jgi:hypothetical protein